MHSANMKIYWGVLSVAFIRTFPIFTTYNVSERVFVSQMLRVVTVEKVLINILNNLRETPDSFSNGAS